jgi:cytochrome b involved in lipid metabolism
MFCGGSGIAPFRSFWASRIQHARHGRNILFLGVQSRSKFLYEEELVAHVRNGDLELHTAFSRDKNGLVYDSATRQLRNKVIEPRYLDATIVENARTVCDLIMSTKQGGCGGYIYICGSVSLYETVMTGIRRAIYVSCASSEKLPEILLATAFAERRMMLDIFMTPRPLSFNEPPIPMTELALHTGHREGSRMWIGVHGIVYDITDFLPTHPGGTLIVAASAGLDASRTFDALAHTNNPEVSTLLPKYAIGRMAPKPKFHEERLDACYADWSRYLSLCVESLTTLSLEVQSILSDSDVWSQGDLLNMGG